MQEHSLAYIIRGLKKPLNRSVTQALAEHLEEVRDPGVGGNLGPLMRQLESAAQLMIPLPEYDVQDFDDNEIVATLRLLAAGDKQAWAQLLDALNDIGSSNYQRLKALSPFAGEFLLFFNVDGQQTHLRTELDPSLAEEFRRLTEVTQFPGNSCVAVVPPEAVAMLQFVDVVDDMPATV